MPEISSHYLFTDLNHILFSQHELTVKSVKKLTADSVVISFEIQPEDARAFRYRQGQYLSVEIEVDGEILRREYSICSSPYAKEDLSVAVRKTATGAASVYMCEAIRPGDVIRSYPPNGKFYTELSSDNRKTYFLIGGGSGITPLYSIAKSVLIAEPMSNVILYYGNETEDDIMFRTELEDMAASSNRFNLYMTLSLPRAGWNGLKGLISKKEIRNLLSTADRISDSEFFICGPQPMMELSRESLLSSGIPEERIHIEYFTPPVLHEEYMPEGIDDDETKDRKVKVIMDEEENLITVPAGGVILDAAIEADLDPPFSCRSGICSTCRAKLHSGKVKMDEREGLKDEEIEEGYILTCQSHPLTDDVVVEYM